MVFHLTRIVFGLCSMTGFAAATVHLTLHGWHLHLPAKLGGTLGGLLFVLGCLLGPLRQLVADRHWDR